MVWSDVFPVFQIKFCLCVGRSNQQVKCASDHPGSRVEAVWLQRDEWSALRNDRSGLSGPDIQIPSCLSSVLFTFLASYVSIPRFHVAPSRYTCFLSNPHDVKCTSRNVKRKKTKVGIPCENNYAATQYQSQLAAPLALSLQRQQC